MQGIEFEDSKDFQGLKVREVPHAVEKQSFMMGLLEKAGVEDKTTANFILLSIAAIGFGIATFLYAGILTEPAKDWSLDAKAAMMAQKMQQ